MGGTTLSLDERIEQLVQFEAEHGHMYVPQSEKGGLGIWVMNARAKWKQGKFKRDETSKLDEIGFVWTVPKGPEKDKQIAWGKQFRLLVKYYKTKGDCDVPSKIAGEENPLFTWCQEQRRLHAKGEMGQDNIEKMTKLGFDFYGPSENREEGPVSCLSTRIYPSLVDR